RLDTPASSFAMPPMIESAASLLTNQAQQTEMNPSFDEPQEPPEATSDSLDNVVEENGTSAILKGPPTQLPQSGTGDECLVSLSRIDSGKVTQSLRPAASSNSLSLENNGVILQAEQAAIPADMPPTTTVSQSKRKIIPSPTPGSTGESDTVAAAGPAPLRSTPVSRSGTTVPSPTTPLSVSLSRSQVRQSERDQLLDKCSERSGSSSDPLHNDSRDVASIIGLERRATGRSESGIKNERLVRRDSAKVAPARPMASFPEAPPSEYSGLVSHWEQPTSPLDTSPTTAVSKRRKQEHISSSTPDLSCKRLKTSGEVYHAKKHDEGEQEGNEDEVEEEESRGIGWSRTAAVVLRWPGSDGEGRVEQREEIDSSSTTQTNGPLVTLAGPLPESARRLDNPPTAAPSHLADSHLANSDWSSSSPESPDFVSSSAAAPDSPLFRRPGTAEVDAQPEPVRASLPPDVSTTILDPAITAPSRKSDAGILLYVTVGTVCQKIIDTSEGIAESQEALTQLHQGFQDAIANMEDAGTQPYERVGTACQKIIDTTKRIAESKETLAQLHQDFQHAVANTTEYRKSRTKQGEQPAKGCVDSLELTTSPKPNENGSMIEKENFAGDRQNVRPDDEGNDALHNRAESRNQASVDVHQLTHQENPVNMVCEANSCSLDMSGIDAAAASVFNDGSWISQHRQNLSSQQSFPKNVPEYNFLTAQDDYYSMDLPQVDPNLRSSTTYPYHALRVPHGAYPNMSLSWSSSDNTMVWMDNSSRDDGGLAVSSNLLS
ncbi:hypothetical protein EJ05DRAFT_481247, partial [Pseudovirgaria hyperparasitica]